MQYTALFPSASSLVLTISYVGRSQVTRAVTAADLASPRIWRAAARDLAPTDTEPGLLLPAALPVLSAGSCGAAQGAAPWHHLADPRVLAYIPDSAPASLCAFFWAERLLGEKLVRVGWNARDRWESVDWEATFCAEGVNRSAAERLDVFRWEVRSAEDVLAEERERLERLMGTG